MINAYLEGDLNKKKGLNRRLKESAETIVRGKDVIVLVPRRCPVCNDNISRCLTWGLSEEEREAVIEKLKAEGLFYEKVVS